MLVVAWLLVLLRVMVRRLFSLSGSFGVVGKKIRVNFLAQHVWRGSLLHHIHLSIFPGPLTLTLPTEFSEMVLPGVQHLAMLYLTFGIIFYLLHLADAHLRS
jgi:hypothetical protein